MLSQHQENPIVLH